MAGRDLDRDPGADARPLARLERRGLGGVEVEAGVAVVGAAREPGAVARAASRGAPRRERRSRARRFRPAAPGRRRSAQSPRTGAASAAGIRARDQRRPSARSVALEVAGQLVELGEPCRPPSRGAAARPRRRRLLERVARFGREAVEPLAGRPPRSRPRRGSPIASSRASVGVQQVDLVEGEQARRRRRRRSPRAPSRRPRSPRGARRSGSEASTTWTIRSASDRLLERRLERLDELMRELADEADRVGDEVAAAAVAVGAGGRVERVEEPLPHPDPRARERVQQRRLARVRVAGEGDGRERRARARRARIDLAVSLQARQAAAQVRDPVAGQPAVGLDLGLPGPRVPIPPPEPLEVGPQARACARGCTRAGRARPGAFPRRCGRGRRRCRGSPRCGRSPAPRAPPPGSAPGAARARRRRRRGWRRCGRSRALSSASLPRPRYRSGSGRGADLDQLAGGRNAGGAQELLQLGERIAVAGRASVRPRSRARAGGREGSRRRRPPRRVGLGRAALASLLHSLKCRSAVSERTVAPAPG